MMSPSARLLCAVAVVSALLGAGWSLAEEAVSTRAVPQPSPHRALPPGAAVILQHAGLQHDEPLDPDPRVGTYVSAQWGFFTSSYWIEGPEGLILIDTQFLPSAAEEFVDFAEKATGKKALLAIVLHPNPDKFNGTGLLKRRGIKVVTSEQVRQLIPSVHEKRLRAFYERYQPDYPKDLADVLPDSFGNKTTELSAGGVTVKAHVLGPGCSEAHVVVEFDGHLFPGDLVANGGHSWLEIGKLDEWLRRLAEMRELEPDFVHPGRGPSGDARLLAREKEYLETVIAEVSAERKRAGPGAPPDPKALERIKERLVQRYTGYSFAIFVEGGLAAEWRRQVAAAKREK
jgi:glyoxylase-like metal-dependent hydrolase (beta-lactamase superfamily II)